MLQAGSQRTGWRRPEKGSLSRLGDPCPPRAYLSPHPSAPHHLGVGGTRRVGGLLGVAGRLSGLHLRPCTELGWALPLFKTLTNTPWPSSHSLQCTGLGPRLLPGTLGNFPGCL